MERESLNIDFWRFWWRFVSAYDILSEIISNELKSVWRTANLNKLVPQESLNIVL